MEIKLIRAINTLGKDNQLGVTMEELAELTQATNKYRRALAGDFDMEKATNMLIEEIADVEIMIEQLKIIADISNETIKNMQDIKLSRLEDKVNATQSRSITIQEKINFRNQLMELANRL